MTSWHLVVLLASVLLLIFLLWKEIRRNNKLRLIWRLLASVLAVLSFYFLAVPPTFNSKKSIAATNEVLLLTDGFNADSLKSYQNRNGQQVKIYTADEAVFTTAKNKNIQFIADFDAWKRQIPANTAVHILGFGLAEEELKQLAPLSIRFNPPVLPPGIQNISWTRRLSAGETFKVQGNLINGKHQKLRILLKTPGTGLDSVETGDKNSIDFSLSARPKQSGRAIYQLLVLDGKDTLANEQLPLIIDAAKTLKLLMLSAAPDFESRFLKNWLGESGYAVAARSAISKNKTATAFTNLNKLSLNKITPALLQNFDVLITDAAEFGNLSAGEKATIIHQNSAKGLGLIIRADSSANASFISQNFAFEAAANPQQNVSVKLNNAAGTRADIQTNHPLFIKNQPDMQVLAADKSGRQLAVIKLNGSGKLLATTLNNTFSWQLSGKKQDYAAFWSLLIARSAHQTNASETLISPLLGAKNSMITLQLATANSKPKLVLYGESVALAQNPQVPFLWSASFWPHLSGWLSADINSKPEWVFIYKDGSWKTISAEKRIKATENLVKKRISADNATILQQKVAKEEVPPIWFYLVFLVSAAFLWFETKLL